MVSDGKAELRLEFSDEPNKADYAEVAENLPRSHETPVMPGQSVLLFLEMAGNVSIVGTGTDSDLSKILVRAMSAGVSIRFLEVSCVRSVPALEFSCSTPFG